MDRIDKLLKLVHAIPFRLVLCFVEATGESYRLKAMLWDGTSGSGGKVSCTEHSTMDEVDREISRLEQLYPNPDGYTVITDDVPLRPQGIA